MLYSVNMQRLPPKPEHALPLVVERLTELLGVGPLDVRQEVGGVDLVVAFPDRTFVVEWKGSARVASVAAGLRFLHALAANHHALIAVPFMGATGASICEDAGVDWLDLSGNAHIVAPGLRILVEGRPNAFRHAGRPRSAFAPKSARIARWLLEHPEEAWSQRALSEATGVDPGFTSRIVRRLLDDELVGRDDQGHIVLRRPSLLLDAWAEDYDFDRHRVHRGVVAARSGTELVARLSEAATRDGAEHAFTGLGAAWQYTHFAAFRLATLYLPGGLTDGLASSFGFRPSERGANTWLVVPDDEGVMHGAALVEGVRCVHPVQAWLDLRAHPERSTEAAQRLRAERLGWRT